MLGVVMEEGKEREGKSTFVLGVAMVEGKEGESVGSRDEVVEREGEY